jgi:predicted nucleic acid-binding protein
MIGATRDAKDDYLVALAVAAGVGALVSGDKDLLAVDPAVVRVLTPREALGEMGR